MTKNKIKFEWYGEIRPETKLVRGIELADLFNLDPRQYTSRSNGCTGFSMPTVQLEGSNPTKQYPGFRSIAMDIYTIRPEKIFSEDFEIEIPRSLEIKSGCLLNSGDILLSDYLYRHYHLYLGKFNEENLMINLLRDSLSSKLYDNGSRAKMQLVFRIHQKR